MSADGRPPAGRDNILNDLINIARRRKALMAITMVATLLSVYVGLLFMPETYEASALLEVMLGRQNTELPVTVQRGNFYPSGVLREEVESKIRALKAREAVETIVDTLGLQAFKFEPPPPQTFFQRVKLVIRNTKQTVVDTVNDGLILLNLKKELTDREKAIELIDSALDAKREGDSHVIRVSIGLPSREVAMNALKVVVRVFLNRDPHLGAASHVLPILERQVSDDTTVIRDLQQKRQQFMEENDLVSVDRQKTELLQRLHKVLYEADLKKSQLATTEARLVELAANPLSQSVRDEITQIHIQVPGLKAGIAQDEANAKTINATLSTLVAAADRLQIMNLEIDSAEKRFTMDAASRDAAKVAQSLDSSKITNVAIISDVGSSPEPVSPKKIRFMGFALAGGLILGITLAMLLEWGSDVIRGRDDVAAVTGIPVLGEFRVDPPGPSGKRMGYG